MGKLIGLLSLGIVAIICIQGCIAKVLSPSPSLEIFSPPRAQDAQNKSLDSTTLTPTISERIHASLNNVLRVPIPLWGIVPVFPGNGGPTSSSAQQAAAAAQQVAAGGNRQQSEQQSSQIGLFGSQNAPPFLPGVNHAIQAIAQLSPLSHWPFGYISTGKPQQLTHFTVPPPPSRSPTEYPTTPITQTTTTTAPPTTTTAATTTVATTTVPSTSVATTSLPAPSPLSTAIPTQAMTSAQVPPTIPIPAHLLPLLGTRPLPSFQAPTAQPQPPQSLPGRIHNRIQSTINNYVRLPNFSQLGQNRPRPMLTEPPWVTELLGPTLEPPTTRAPSIGERIQNSLQNVLLFVPATLLNVWYENWGTSHVDRIISRLSTPRPGALGQPVFATFSNNGPNPFSNFSSSSFGGGQHPDLPAIAAFINNNGTLTPTIVHPVVNKTANTVEYQLRSDNETTVLWTGMLSNDVFFGNKKKPIEDDELELIEEEEDAQEKNKRMTV